MVDKISIVPHCLVIECVRLRMDFLAIPIRLRSADAAWFRRETKKRPGKQADLFRDMRRAYEREQKALKSRDYVAHGSPASPFQTAQERSHGVEIASEGVRTPKTGKGA